MSLLKKVAIRRVAFLLMSVAAAACAASIATEDWGAITPDADIRVITLDGEQHDLTGVAVSTDSLVGRSQDSGADVRFAIEDIEFIEGRSNPAFPILAAVAALGVTVWLIEASGKSDVRPAPTPVPNSCPFIYSFDGHDYRLDSETFAGAITSGVQRTDLDNLEHLRDVDGTYRLLLTNERPETQYTDALTLLAVDHPVGSAVYPDAAGTPHSVRDLTPPLVAYGLRGAEALEEVRAEDGRYWTGDPIEDADLDRPEDLRDGLELTFPRPDRDRAALVIGARNTEVVPAALTAILELHGDGLVDWYRQVDRDPDLQERLLNWVVREGMLHVSVWTDDGWEPQGVFLDVGPNLPKKQVALLDLSATTGSEVRLRIEAPRGLWAIDWVALGALDDTGISTRKLSAESALGPGGRDLTGALAEVDGSYHTALPGDTVWLSFNAGEVPPAGMERTVLAESSGFYHLYTNHAGAGQPEIFDRILDEPLFGTRYLLALSRELAEAEMDESP